MIIAKGPLLPSVGDATVAADHLPPNAFKLYDGEGRETKFMFHTDAIFSQPATDDVDQVFFEEIHSVTFTPIPGHGDVYTQMTFDTNFGFRTFFFMPKQYQALITRIIRTHVVDAPPTPQGPFGPGNRATADLPVPTRARSQSAMPDLDDADYELQPSDLRGLRPRQRTFADAGRRQSARQPAPSVAVRFRVFVGGRNTKACQAMFDITEKVSALHEFVAREVREAATGFDLRFVNQIVPRDEAKTLLSQNITGRVVLDVIVK
jgi:hypothetical protein